MAIKVGISGFGRISRLAIRTAMDMPDIEIAGINYRNADLEYLEYMLKYDSVFGRFPAPLGRYEGGLVLNGKEVPVYSESNPSMIPWAECGAEYIAAEPWKPHVVADGMLLTGQNTQSAGELALAMLSVMTSVR